MNRHITLQTPQGSLHGQLIRPDVPRGLVLIARAHHTAADVILANNFTDYGYATLTMELLSAQEMQFIDATQNVPRLTLRLIDILDMIRNDGDMEQLPLAIFTTGDIAPAAIRAAARRDAQVRVIACHGGLIDRAGLEALDLLEAPLLMLLDADDDLAQAAWRRAGSHLRCTNEMHEIKMGEDPTHLVAEWFVKNTPE